MVARDYGVRDDVTMTGKGHEGVCLGEAPVLYPDSAGSFRRPGVLKFTGMYTRRKKKVLLSEDV